MKLEEFYIDGNYTETSLIIEACDLQSGLVTKATAVISSINDCKNRFVGKNINIIKTSSNQFMYYNIDGKFLLTSNKGAKSGKYKIKNNELISHSEGFSGLLKKQVYTKCKIIKKNINDILTYEGKLYYKNCKCKWINFYDFILTKNV